MHPGGGLLADKAALLEVHSAKNIEIELQRIVALPRVDLQSRHTPFKTA
jgi:hypothetical protein